jgi:hypothetical protein
MIVCPKCGQENPDRTQTCTECHIDLDWALANAGEVEGEATVSTTGEPLAETTRVGRMSRKQSGCVFGAMALLGLAVGVVLLFWAASTDDWELFPKGLFLALPLFAIGILGLISVGIAYLVQRSRPSHE